MTRPLTPRLVLVRGRHVQREHAHLKRDERMGPGVRTPRRPAWKRYCTDACGRFRRPVCLFSIELALHEAALVIGGHVALAGTARYSEVKAHAPSGRRMRPAG